MVHVVLLDCIVQQFELGLGLLVSKVVGTFTKWATDGVLPHANLKYERIST